MVQDASLDDLKWGKVRQLKHLCKLRRNHLHQFNEVGIRLLNSAIFATFCDLCGIGDRDTAKDIVGSLSEESRV